MGGCFGSMGANHLMQGLAIGGAAGLAVAWLITIAAVPCLKDPKARWSCYPFMSKDEML